MAPATGNVSQNSPVSLDTSMMLENIILTANGCGNGSGNWNGKLNGNAL